ncbi:MAG: hypothetical protein ACRD9R_11205, partial [Pyrinomonadaceae bacterium]
MIRHNRSRFLTLFTAFSLALLLVGGILITDRSRASAATVGEKSHAERLPLLSRYATDLTAQAGAQAAQSADEDATTTLNRLTRTLARTPQVSPVLLDETGAARARQLTASLARTIARGDAAGLKHKRLFRLDLAALSAGEDFEGRLQAILAEAAGVGRGSVVLVVDELNSIVGPGAAYGERAATLLRDALTRGELQLLAAATPEFFAQQISTDAALSKLFQRISLDATDEDADDVSRQSREAAGFVGDKISSDLREMIAGGAEGARVRLILQAGDTNDARLKALLKSQQARVVSRMSGLGMLEVELPAAAVEKVAEAGAVNYLSPDQQVLPFGSHVTRTSGVDAVRLQSSGSDGDNAFLLDGAGVG